LRSVIVRVMTDRSSDVRRRRAGVSAALLLACATAAVAAPAASALSKTARDAAPQASAVSDGVTAPGVKAPPPLGLAHHSPLFGHLPPAKENIEVVGDLNLISPSTGLPVKEGQVADVAVHKGYAYLNSWDSPTCQDGGTFVVDIRNPAAPRQIAFIPAQAPFYHGEGAHVVSIDTPQFKGDILAVNDETYGSNLTLTTPCAPTSKLGGGFDLYNVTDPAHPVALVQGAGDRSPEGSVEQDPAEVAKSYHSVFVWQDGPRAYLVASDNTELADVDIFDITDPTDPEFINDLDLLESPQADEIVDQGANGNAIFHHDVVVKKIVGQMRMLVSYWDGGYVQLDVDDPRHATYIGDTDFDDPDPLTGLEPPEGNAHEAEYSHDNQFFLAADEDFAPFRLISRITEAPSEGLNFSSALSDAEPIELGTTISGDTVFVGEACAAVAPPPAGVTIAVAERGTCNFQVKADMIEAAGYEMGVIFNNNVGGDAARCEVLINMLIDPDTIDIPMLFVGRATALRILSVFDESTYQCTGATAPTAGDTPVPAVGTAGLAIQTGSVGDGWGYAHLYDAETNEEIDAYAIPESLDDRYGTDFGDLSIHEFATDPSTNLAYAAYYAGGLRVLRFSRADGLQEVGKFIDEDGSNFWGVEQFTDKDGNRLIAGSDRDYGLYIVKYTGPGAVKAPSAPPPAPPPAPPAAPPVVAAAVPAPRPVSLFSFGSSKRVTISSRGRATIVIKVPGAGTATASLKARIGKRMVTLGRTTRTASRAGNLTLTFRVSASNMRALRRTLARRSTRRTSGSAQVSYTPTGGTRLRRNRSLSIAIRR